MTKKQLESMVGDIKKPNLNQGEVRRLLDFGDDNIVPIQKAQSAPQRVTQPIPQRVAQSIPQKVTQLVPQRVAQPVPQRVTQEVAQSLWVAQNDTLLDMVNIAQAIGQKVVKPFKPKSSNRRLEKSSYDQSVWEGVEKLKEYIYNLPTIEDKKKFVLNIGWGIGEERRGKRNYLYGAKKINSIKYKLYIGNPTHL